MPFTYRSASQEFDRYLEEMLHVTNLQTRNQCYTMTRSVFLVFRSHVAPQVAMDFAQSLPAVLRAIFVEDWDLSVPVTPFADRATLTAEVLAIRADHNVPNSNAIAEVALVLSHVMPPLDYRFMIEKLPPDAQAFWRVS